MRKKVGGIGGSGIKFDGRSRSQGQWEKNVQDAEGNDAKVRPGTVNAGKAAIVVHFATAAPRAKPMNDYLQKKQSFTGQIVSSFFSVLFLFSLPFHH